MSSKETAVADKPAEIAESIRRLNSAELGQLIEKLCQDNMGSKLVTGLQAEIQDQTYMTEV